MALLIGGVSYDDQDRKLDRGADVVIATPGRLLDHFERGKLLLNGIEILVVDEADRMLDMGFIPDIERICKLLPFTRQTLFFSATMPPEIQRLADKFLHSPERIEVAPPATAAATIVQRLKKAPDDPAGKREALRALMRGSRRQERHHLLQSQEGRRYRLPVAAPPRLQRRRPARRSGPASAHGDAGCLPQRDRSPSSPQATWRRAGSISPSQPHLQLRRADPPRRLCPPHRPHRPRGTRGLRRHAGDTERRQGAQGDRENAPPGDSVGRRRAESSGAQRRSEARSNGNGKHRRGNRARRGKPPGGSGPTSHQQQAIEANSQPAAQQPQRPAKCGCRKTATAPSAG